MKKYYYAENEQEFGPFSIEELKPKRIRKSTLVWVEGLPDWVMAENIDELKEIINLTPPKLPKKSSIGADLNSKYDSTYVKEKGAAYTGLLLFAASFFCPLIFLIIMGENEKSYQLGKAVFGIIFLVVRIAVTFWVVNISSRQNRDSGSWGLFAFLFPSITLIFIGVSKKLKFNKYK